MTVKLFNNYSVKVFIYPFFQSMMSLSSVHVGQVFAGLYEDLWYRVAIKQVLQDQVPGFGNLGFGIELTVCKVIFCVTIYNNPDFKIINF